MTDKRSLLAEYVQNGSDAAFRELVNRYIDLVYSSALRLVGGDSHRAQDVAQMVFVDLARAARTLPEDVKLGGWLHRDTCFVAATLMRGERRRQSRERQAVEMNALQDNSGADYSSVAPMLDEAINELGEADRTAILLRFFEQHDFRTVGQVLGSNEDAARMRVTRALEKLESLLKRRGVTASSGALAGVLGASAVQAAPVGLAATLSTAAIAGTTLTAAAATATKTIAMTTLQKAIIGATLAAAVGTGIYEARQTSNARAETEVLRQQQTALTEQIQQLTHDRDDASNQVAALREEIERLNRNSTELLRLREEVGRLKRDARAANAGSANLSADAAKSWLTRATNLKQRFEQASNATIPELQYIMEEDWLNAARRELKTEKDYRRAMSEIREAAVMKFLEMLRPALKSYLKANNGKFPTELSQLKPFADSALPDAILQRYEIIATGKLLQSAVSGEWTIQEKNPIDEEFDSRGFLTQRGGMGFSDWEDQEEKDQTKNSGAILVLTPLIGEYKAANNGSEPTDVTQLRPYIKTPAQEAAFQTIVEAVKKQKEAKKN